MAAQVAAIGLAAFLSQHAVRRAVWSPRLTDHLRPLYQRLVTDHRAGDFVGVHFRGLPVFEYYNRTGQVQSYQRIGPIDAVTAAQTSANRVSGNNRAWLVFCHFRANEIPAVPECIIAASGLQLADRWTAPRAEIWKLTRGPGRRELTGVDPIVWNPLNGRERAAALSLRLVSDGRWASLEMPMPPDWKGSKKAEIEVDFTPAGDPEFVQEVTIILHTDLPRTYLWSACDGGAVNRLRATLAKMKAVREDSSPGATEFPFDRLVRITVRCRAMPGRRAEVVVRRIAVTSPDTGDSP